MARHAFSLGTLQTYQSGLHGHSKLSSLAKIKYNPDRKVCCLPTEVQTAFYVVHLKNIPFKFKLEERKNNRVIVFKQ